MPTGQFINVSSTSTRLSKIYPKDKFIPLQYTGLHDRNGKEIYEGDIIKTTSELCTNFGRTPTGKFQTEYFSIEWSSEDAKCKERRLRDSWLAPLGICQKIIGEYSEIIGNIYENPELLKVADA